MSTISEKSAIPGYTLPVFACASAVAALQHLHQASLSPSATVSINLLEPAKIVEIPIEQVAKISSNQALAITRSDPGNNLDLTRNTPIWALVEVNKCEAVSTTESAQITIQGGEGIGRQLSGEGEAAIYSYADQLLRSNLQRLLLPQESVTVTIILPEGRRLAQRTSNAAFGVVEGLSLLGTTGIAQPLSTPGQLELYLQELLTKASQDSTLVFCIGENGLDLARQLGINPQQLVKTANWLGPMLAEAGRQQIKSILLFGYHGKLIKLAGGIFHTHHHLADGRLEILTAHCAQLGLPRSILQQIFTSTTTEAALQYLREFDFINHSNWVEQVYLSLAQAIEERSQNYIRKHSEQQVIVGSVMFDRQRNIIVSSPCAKMLLEKI